VLMFWSVGTRSNFALVTKGGIILLLQRLNSYGLVLF
jgi:hypothetical protein